MVLKDWLVITDTAVERRLVISVFVLEPETVFERLFSELFKELGMLVDEVEEL